MFLLLGILDAQTQQERVEVRTITTQYSDNIQQSVED